MATNAAEIWQSIKAMGLSYRYRGPRGGVYNWTQRELLALYKQVVYYVDTDRGGTCWEMLNSGKYRYMVGTIYKHRIYNTAFGAITPKPSPCNWANVNYDENTSLYTMAQQLVSGIAAPVTLQITYPTWSGILGVLKDVVPSGWTNGGTSATGPSGKNWVYPASGYNLVVNPEEYVSFGCYPGLTVPDSTLVTITDITDAPYVLDTFTAEVIALVPIVRPDPTPGWSPIELDASTGQYILAVQQIQGTNVPIELELNYDPWNALMFYKIDTVAPPYNNGGSDFTGPVGPGWVQFASGTSVTLNPNEYLSFGCEVDVFPNASTSIQVLNISDSYELLNTFSATIYGL